MTRLLQSFTADNGVVLYRAAQFLDAGIPHGFSTRLGGVSQPPFDSLNLGNPQPCAAPDSDEHLAANYARFQEAAGCPSRQRVSVHQVHGNGLALPRRGEPFDIATRADALVSDDPARVLAVRTADCVPILLASADGRWVSAIHAGWRGVIAGVVPLAVDYLTGSARCGAGDLLGAIGPCIGIDAFEVGPEVARAFEAHFGADAPLRAGREDRAHVDLRAAVRLQLLAAGFAEDRLTSTDRCTSRDRGEFFSHRRDNGLTGRHCALVAPVGP